MSKSKNHKHKNLVLGGPAVVLALWRDKQARIWQLCQRWSLATLSVIIMFSSPVYAQCTNNLEGVPGVAGEMEYFGDDILYYCDGTDWIKMQERDCPVGITSCGGDPNERVVFVYDGSARGALGGVSGADAYCQQEAIDNGLKGTYYAWIADTDPSSAPAFRFERSTVPYVRVSGVKIADDWDDLTDGTLDNSIRYQADNTQPGLAPVWTNVSSDGTQDGSTANDSCNDWTTSSGAVTGGAGRRDSSSGGWTNQNTRTCDSGGNEAYCFEQQGTYVGSVCETGSIGTIVTEKE